MGRTDPGKAHGNDADHIVARYRGPLLSFFRRRVRDAQEAEDLTQEVFLRILRRDEAVPLDNPEIYIFRTAANLLRDRARRGATRRVSDHTSLEGLFEEVNQGAPVEGALIEDRGPERVLLSQEALVEVMRALDELGPRARDIFILARLEKMKHRDIAAGFGLTVSSVEKYVARATVLLIQKFGARGGIG